MTRTTACRLAVLVAIVQACLPTPMAALARAQAKVDVTGTWAFEVQTEAGTGTPQVTFKQDGEKLTGVYSSQLLGELELTGSVKGRRSSSPSPPTCRATRSNWSSAARSTTAPR